MVYYEAVVAQLIKKVAIIQRLPASKKEGVYRLKFSQIAALISMSEYEP
jgi:hypothetical protein